MHQCSVFYTPFLEFAKCATTVDWTIAALIATVVLGPVLAFCVRLTKKGEPHEK